MITALRVRSNVCRAVGFAVAVLAVSPAIAFAQFGGGGGMGGGGMRGGGGGRGGMGRGGARGGVRPMNAKSARDSLLNRIGYARFVLTHTTDLELTSEQSTAISAVDSGYHVVADTMLVHLDALHSSTTAAIKELATIGSDSVRMAAWRATAVARRDTVGQVTASLRTIQQDNRTKTVALLSEPQRQQVEILLSSSEDGPGGGEGGGQRRGGGGRPPR